MTKTQFKYRIRKALGWTLKDDKGRFVTPKRPEEN